MSIFNQYNASKFQGALTEIERAKSAVAEILYRVRTGDIETVDESVAKDALMALDAIVSGLQDLGSREKA